MAANFEKQHSQMEIALSEAQKYKVLTYVYIYYTCN